MADVIAGGVVDVVLDCYVVSFLRHWMHLHGFLVLIAVTVVCERTRMNRDWLQLIAAG